MNDNYSDVIGYGSKEKKLKPLQDKVNSVFESLVFSQELDKVTGEVQSQFGNIKEARNKLVVELFTNNSSQDYLPQKYFYLTKTKNKIMKQ